MWTRPTLHLLAFTATLFGAFGALADSAQSLEKTWKICPSAVNARERKDAIPARLMGAISQAESGRWNKQKQANIAWPWTVTGGRRGKFFDTKAEAVAEVEFLMTRGVRNIDVGCMQINLAAHPNAFETIEAAFDPALNAAYGARYLKAMQRRTGNWLNGAAAYHSRTPHLSAKYRAKVVRIWNELRGRPVPVVETAEKTKAEPEGARKRRRSDIDYGRLAQLNRNFRARNGATPAAEPVDAAARRRQTRQKQITEWRQAQARGTNLNVLAGLRQAERAKRRKRELVSFGKRDKAAAFAERRRRQVNDWRSNRRVAFKSPDITAANN